MKAIHVVSLTTDLIAVCRSSGHTNCANLHIFKQIVHNCLKQSVEICFKQIVQICFKQIVQMCYRILFHCTISRQKVCLRRFFSTRTRKNIKLVCVLYLYSFIWFFYILYSYSLTPILLLYSYSFTRILLLVSFYSDSFARIRPFCRASFLASTLF